MLSLLRLNVKSERGIRKEQNYCYKQNLSLKAFDKVQPYKKKINT
jgi:hypothetical protein